MQCIHHPDKPSSTLCTRCDQPLCADCIQERNDRPFCASCAEFLDRRPARPRPGTGQFPVPPAPPATQDVYGGPTAPPADEIYSGPTESPAGQGAAGANSGLYNELGADADGVYQGPAPGEVYSGPAAGPTPSMAPAGAASGEEKGFLIRGLLLGLLAASISIGLWYWISIATEKNYSLLALIIGALVGYGTLIGTGRHGMDVAVLSVCLFCFAMITGEYMAQNHFHKEWVTEMRDISSIKIDGHYTDEEARKLLGLDDAEWREMSPDDRREAHSYLRDGGDEYEEYDDYLTEAERREAQQEWQEEVATMTDSLSFGEFMGNFIIYFRIFGLFCLAIGAWEAFKIPLGSS